MPVRMFVSDLTIDRNTKTPILLLRDAGGEMSLPIYIGLMEASAIAAAKENLKLPRPMTHDLLTELIAALGGSLEAVEVCDLCEGTFFAVLKIRRDEELLEVDSRPSDAIALAIRSDAPIWVSESVIDEAGVPCEKKDKWMEFLENLDPEDFGKYKM